MMKLARLLHHIYECVEMVEKIHEILCIILKLLPASGDDAGFSTAVYMILEDSQSAAILLLSFSGHCCTKKFY
jgi:hypothetical protein